METGSIVHRKGCKNVRENAFSLLVLPRGLGAGVPGCAAGAHRRGSERRTLPPGGENRGCPSPRPGDILHARFFPHGENRNKQVSRASGTGARIGHRRNKIEHRHVFVVVLLSVCLLFGFIWI